MRQAGLISSIGECSYAPIPTPVSRNWFHSLNFTNKTIESVYCSDESQTALQTPNPNPLYGNFDMNGQSNPLMVMVMFCFLAISISERLHVWVI